MKTLDSGLRELAESKEYQQDFQELKKTILTFKPKKPSYKNRKSAPPPFIKVDLDKSIKAGVIDRCHIPLEEVQSLLRNGNINECRVQIPGFFSTFKDKYGLRFLFDPGQPYPGGLSFFEDGSIIAHLPDGGTKISMTVDISYPVGVLETKFKMVIRTLKETWKLREKRRERYSEDKIYEVRERLQKGMKLIDIVREKYPGFVLMKNYTLNPKKNLSDYDAYAYYRWVERIIERTKTRRA